MIRKFKLLRGIEKYATETEDRKLCFMLNHIVTHGFELILYVYFNGEYREYLGFVRDTQTRYNDYVTYVDYLVDRYNQRHMVLYSDLNNVTTPDECREFGEGVIRTIVDRFNA